VKSIRILPFSHPPVHPDVVGGILMLECGGRASAATPLWVARSAGVLLAVGAKSAAATALPGLTHNFGMHGPSAFSW
jgi:hypothetical protein